MDSTNRSNTGDRPVRVITVYADGHVSHRDISKGRAPWTKGSGWGRAGAHAAVDEGPTAAPRVKNPAKVAAGKARAAQAKAKREADAAKAAKVAATQAKAKRPRGGARAGAGAKAKAGTAMVVIAFRGTPEQKKKFDKLGGGEWMRKRIDSATLPQ